MRFASSERPPSSHGAADSPCFSAAHINVLFRQAATHSTAFMRFSAAELVTAIRLFQEGLK